MYLEQKQLVQELTQKITMYEKREKRWMQESKKIVDKKHNKLQKMYDNMKKTGSKEGQREVIKKFLTEKGFTENQVKIMTRKGGKKAPPVEWTDEEMKDAMHQRRLGKGLYYHLFGDAWGVNPKFPMPSKNRI